MQSIRKDCLENVSKSDIGRRLTLVVGEQPILTGIIHSVTDSNVSVNCECADNGGVIHDVEVRFERGNTDVICSFVVHDGVAKV